MGRYPFTECVNEYLPSEEGHLAPSTMDALGRRLRQIAGIFHDLRIEGLVSTENPKKVTAEDIDAFVGYRRKNGAKAATVNKDLGCLMKMLIYFDNDAVLKFRTKYPAHYPKRYKRRGPSIEEERVQTIIGRAMQISLTNWEMMEAYGLVTLAICTGFRPKELRMLSVDNVNVTDKGIEIYAEHVKGEGLYGVARWVAVHPDGVPVLLRYLEARRLRLEKAGKREDALFPPLKKKGGYLSYGRIRTLKSFVEEDLGFRFELRKCRRTFGQRALNEGQEIHDVSLVMGHSSVATTQGEYCDKDLHEASRDMQKFWNDKEDSE